MGLTTPELADAIAKELNSSKSLVPEGHKGAFITHLDESGVRTAIAAKINNVWEVQGDVGYHPHSDRLDWGLNVTASW